MYIKKTPRYDKDGHITRYDYYWAENRREGNKVKTSIIKKITEVEALKIKSIEKEPSPKDFLEIRENIFRCRSCNNYFDIKFRHYHHPVIAKGRNIPHFFEKIGFPIDFESAKEIPDKIPICWWCHSQTTSWRIRNLSKKIKKEIFGPFYKPNASK